MKNIVLFYLIIVTNGNTQAQTLGEWTRQRSTQERYNLQQVAALKAFGIALTKGYQIAQTGLHTVASIRDGEWQSHRSYFGAFSDIPTVLQKSEQLKEVVLLYRQTLKTAQAIAKWKSEESHLTSAEKTYLEKALTNLAAESEQLVEAFISLITPGDLQLSYAGRWQRLLQLHQELAGQQVFLRTVFAGALHLSKARKQELHEIRLSGKRHQLP